MAEDNCGMEQLMPVNYVHVCNMTVAESRF